MIKRYDMNWDTQSGSYEMEQVQHGDYIKVTDLLELLNNYTFHTLAESVVEGIKEELGEK